MLTPEEREEIIKETVSRTLENLAEKQEMIEEERVKHNEWLSIRSSNIWEEIKEILR